MAKETEELKDEVRQTTNLWAHNRQLFPGWLVTPHQNRETLWTRTQNWIDPIIRVQDALTPCERILILHELNWRLERCLIPLWHSLIDPLVHALEAINPFPGTLELSEPEIKLSDTDHTDADYSNVPAAWIDLALAAVRFFRETRDVESFQEWTEKLAPLRHLCPEVQQRLYYETCLNALGSLDYESAKSVLAEWEALHDDPYWRVRRGAVLAEIGDVASAEAEVDAALTQIRQLSRSGEPDIWLQSREGWTMVLSRALKFYRRLVAQEPLPDLRGRWGRLTASRCNPWDEIEFFKAALEYRPPLTQKVTQTVGFDPAQRRSTVHLGERSAFADVLLPRQFLRLSEEAGYPPRAGNVKLAADQFVDAAGWLVRLDVRIAAHAMVRTCEKKKAEKFFSRHRVAALSDELAEDLVSDLSSAVDGALRTLSSPQSARGEGSEEANNSRLQTALELLSRLCVRLPPEKMGAHLDKAVELYESEVMRRRLLLHKPLLNLFRRLLQSMNAASVEDQLLELVSLPIPGVGGFDVPLLDTWLEPCQHIRAGSVSRGARQDETRWVAAVARLIDLASESQGERRPRSVARLTKLHEHDLLNGDEKIAFEAALWNQTDPDTCLPSGTWLHKWAFLELSGQHPDQAKKLFRDYCLNAELPRFRRVSEDEDGKPVTTIVGLSAPNLLLIDIARGTSKRGDGCSNAVDWSSEEAKQIFAHLKGWWEEEGQDLIEDPSPFVATHILPRLRAVTEVARIAVAPRAEAGGSLAAELVTFVDDLQGLNLPVQDVLPSLLKLDPGREMQVAGQLRHGLVSTESRHAAVAVKGLYHWASEREQLGVAPAPDLLQELSAIIQARRQPALGPALEYTVDLLDILDIEGTEASFGEAFYEALLTGLRYLLEETTYQPASEVPGAKLPYEEVPEYREQAARLASLLRKKCGVSDRVLEAWRQASREDPLPEVRRASSCWWRSRRGRCAGTPTVDE